MITPAFLLRLAITCLVLLQAACIGGSTPPSHFYLLEPLSETVPANPNTNKLSISLTPIKIPRYLDRSQMVTAIGKNAYQIDELNRWAENLEDNMTRVMLQDLAALVPADVVLAKTARAQQVPLRLTISVLEFHVDSQGQAGLAAQWQVSQAEKIIMNRQNAYYRPASKTDVQQQVEALNQCFNLLVMEIANAIKVM